MIHPVRRGLAAALVGLSLLTACSPKPAPARPDTLPARLAALAHAAGTSQAVYVSLSEDDIQLMTPDGTIWSDAGSTPGPPASPVDRTLAREPFDIGLISTEHYSQIHDALASARADQSDSARITRLDGATQPLITALSAARPGGAVSLHLDLTPVAWDPSSALGLQVMIDELQPLCSEGGVDEVTVRSDGERMFCRRGKDIVELDESSVAHRGTTDAPSAAADERFTFPGVTGEQLQAAVTRARELVQAPADAPWWAEVTSHDGKRVVRVAPTGVMSTLVRCIPDADCETL